MELLPPISPNSAKEYVPITPMLFQANAMKTAQETDMKTIKPIFAIPHAHQANSETLPPIGVLNTVQLAITES